MFSSFSRLLLVLVALALLLLVVVSFLPDLKTNQAVGMGVTPTIANYLPFILKPFPSPTPSPTATNIPATPTATATSAPPANVKIIYIEYDPPGPDVEGEYVQIDNLGGTSATMTNWTLADEANHVFTFPTFVLVPGGSVRIWTKSGVNNSTNLYWGSGAAIWNNTGDTATLRNNHGQVVDICSYTGGGTGANCH